MRGKALSGFLWSATERFFSQGVSLILFVVLGRLLTPQDFGLVAIAATIALLGQMLLSESFAEALVLADQITPRTIDAVFWLLATAGAALALGLYLLAEPIARVFGHPEVAGIVRAVSPTLFFSALKAVPYALLRRDLAFRSIARVTTMTGLAAAGGAVLIAIEGGGLWALVFNLIAQSVLVAIGLWLVHRYWPRHRFSWSALDGLRTLGRNLVLLRCALMLNQQAPRLLVGYLFGPAALGLFTVALRLNDALTQLVSIPASNVAVPVFARLKGEPARLERALLAANRLTASATFALFAGSAAVAPLLVPLLFGRQWEPAVPLTQLLCLLGAMQGLSMVAGGIVRGAGRPDLQLYMTLGGAITTLAVMVALKDFGLSVVVGAMAVRAYVLWPSLGLVIRRISGIGIRAQLASVLPAAAAAAAMLFGVDRLLGMLDGRISPMWQLPLSVLAGGTLYLLVLRVLDRTIFGQIRQSLVALRGARKLPGLAEGI